jgi:hypothetical protein
MRAMALWVGVVAVGLGCAADRGAQKADRARPGEPPDPVAALGGEAKVRSGARYVDQALGFEVTRPTAAWTMDVSDDLTADGIATPVVMRNPETGAQVVIQVAPAVATPVQLAERLTEGMRSHPGFVTSDPEPLALADGAVGFRFAMGDRVLGRVAVREGAEGRVLMLLATWPAGAPEDASNGVDQVFEGILPVNGGMSLE